MRTNKKIEEIQKKIDYLQAKQSDFQNYISKLQSDLNEIKKEINIESSSSIDLNDLIKPTTLIQKVDEKPIQKIEERKIPKETFLDKIKKEIGFDWDVKSDFENFIGTNLFNKIGIIILIIGVVVGTKLAIDKNLISPLARIIIGYVISFGLLVFSIRLKIKYSNFSAVLLSGSLAMLYFLSYIAYDFYSFIPQTVTFGLMFVFTVFSVIASLNYNNKIIALIGLVGSYAIPFLLSNNSGNVLFLFSYISIINIGILVLSFKKNWKILYYTAFIFTWLIFSVWFGQGFSRSTHFAIAMIFSSIFYITFYVTFLAYKIIKKESFEKTDIIFIMLNSFTFYSLGFAILNTSIKTSEYLGLFTVLNAIVHFVVSKIIFKQKNEDKSLFYLASVMVLIFITMAIPVQLEGSWTTLFWSMEAALLFWIGRTKKIAIYEKLSYTLIFLAFFSLLEDWQHNYFYNETKAFLNITFLTAIISSISFGFITKIFFDTKYISAIQKDEQTNIYNKLLNAMKFVIPIFFIIILFGTFAKEINEAFNIHYHHTAIEISQENNYTYKEYNYDIFKFQHLSLIFYALFFVLTLSFINLKFIQNKLVGKISIIANAILIFVGLTLGFMICSDLRDSYLLVSENDFFNKGKWFITIRYFNYALISLLVFITYRTIKMFYNKQNYRQIFWLALNIIILWFLSSELLNIMDLKGNKNAYKLAISILWASYSLLSVAIGIWKKQKYLRLGAIGLFALTLVKLFLYDLSHLSAIHKTIVLISLGVILLIVSFLYNKYVGIIENKDIEKENIEEEKGNTEK